MLISPSRDFTDILHWSFALGPSTYTAWWLFKNMVRFCQASCAHQLQWNHRWDGQKKTAGRRIFLKLIKMRNLTVVWAQQDTHDQPCGVYWAESQLSSIWQKPWAWRYHQQWRHGNDKWFFAEIRLQPILDVFSSFKESLGTEGYKFFPAFPFITVPFWGSP